MDTALLIGAVILTIIYWTLYHKIWQITYFGDTFKHIAYELVVCFFLAYFSVAVVLSLIMKVFQGVGTIFGVIFDFLFTIIRYGLIVVAIGGVIFFIIKAVSVLKNKLTGDKRGNEANVKKQNNVSDSQMASGNPGKKGADNSSMVCKTCGNPISENDKFCMKCGSKVEQQMLTRTSVETSEEKTVQKSVCPKCGNEVDENDKFCMACGIKIEK